MLKRREQTQQEQQAEATRQKLLVAEAAALLLLQRRRDSVVAAGVLAKSPLGGIANSLSNEMGRAIAGARSLSRAAGMQRLADEAAHHGVAISVGQNGVVPIDILRGQRYGRKFGALWLEKASAAPGDLRTKARAAVAATKPRLETIAVSESSEAFNGGRRDALAVEAPHLLRIWDATLDKSTCPVCSLADGTIVGAREPFPQGEPGAVHARCRCAWHIVGTVERGTARESGTFKITRPAPPARAVLAPAPIRATPLPVPARAARRVIEPVVAPEPRDLAKLPAVSSKQLLESGVNVKDSEALRRLHKRLNALLPQSTHEERTAVERFTRGYDAIIRGHQRGLSRDELIAVRKQTIEAKAAKAKAYGVVYDIHAADLARAAAHVDEGIASAAHLESFLEKAGKATKAAPKVFRGLALNEDAVHKILDAGVIELGGQTTSFSWAPSVASDFAATNATGGKVAVMLQVKHKSGVAIETLSQYSIEKEVLLPGSARLKIKSVRRIDYSDKPVTTNVAGIPLRTAAPEAGTKTVLIEAEEL